MNNLDQAKNEYKDFEESEYQKRKAKNQRQIHNRKTVQRAGRASELLRASNVPKTKENE